MPRHNFISPSLQMFLIICNISYVKVIFHTYDTETIRTKDARNNVFFNYFQLMGVNQSSFPLNLQKMAKLEVKTYVDRTKQIQQKKLPQVWIERGTLGLWNLLCYTLMPSSLS